MAVIAEDKNNSLVAVRVDGSNTAIILIGESVHRITGQSDKVIYDKTLKLTGQDDFAQQVSHWWPIA
jgi:hypothetical protein